MGDKRVSNNLLKQVADLIYRKDWQRLANKLGFMSEDVDEIRAEESDPKQQVRMVNLPASFNNTIRLCHPLCSISKT